MRALACWSASVVWLSACSGAVISDSPSDGGPTADGGPAFDAGVVDSDLGDAQASPPVELGSMSLARSLLGASAGADGRLRVFNGLTSLGVTTSMETYDPATNAWTQGPSASIKRYGHAVATDAEGNAYVLGGTSDGKTPIASVEMYSPKTDSWTAIADLPSARLGLAAAFGADGKLYAFGGRGVDGTPSGIVEVYTPTAKTWSTASPMPSPRFSLAAVKVLDGRIFAMGGRDASAIPVPYSTVEIFDPAKNAWTAGPAMHSTRYWFGATLGADGRIYASGGITDFGFTDYAEVLDPTTLSWTALPNMPESRAWNASATAKDGRIFVIGGAIASKASGTPPPVSTAFAFDPKTNAWSRMTR